MNRRTFKTAVICSLLSCAACTDDIFNPDTILQEDLGSFQFLESSNTAIPYEQGQVLHFSDGADHSLQLTVDVDKTIYIDAHIPSLVTEEGGPIMEYKYESKARRLELSSQDGQFAINLLLRANLYYKNPESGDLADMLYLFFENLHTGEQAEVFSYMVNQRSMPEDLSNNIYYATTSFYGKPYQGVYKSIYQVDPPSEVYYNLTQGIVAFTDTKGTLWSLDID